MKKELDLSELNLERKDKGKPHSDWRWSNVKIGMYNLNGRLEATFNGIADAARNNTVGADYKGIHACVVGKLKKHCKKIWRAEVYE